MTPHEMSIPINIGPVNLSPYSLGEAALWSDGFTQESIDLFYGRAINRIRGFYLRVAGSESRHFALGGHDDVYGVLANMGIGTPSRWQLYLTLASMIGIVNSVVGGTAVALAAGVIGASLGVAILAGGGGLLMSVALHSAMQRRTHDSARESDRPLFPTNTERG